MARIDSYPVLDFSGGVRRDASSFQLRKNELLDARNVHLEEKGRVRTRLGSQQLGQTLTGTIENSFFYRENSAGTSYGALLVNNAASSSVISILYGTTLSADVAVGDTTINVVSTTSFSASGTIEIDGDLISYTGVGATTFTGVSGITSAHTSGTQVQQWLTLTQSGTAIDSRAGLSYAVLDNKCIISGAGPNIKQLAFTLGSPTITDVTPTNEPSIVYIVNYHDRIYGAGAGNADPHGLSSTVYFSSRGNGTAWDYTADYFDVGDQDNQPITNLKVYSNNLGIFKMDKTFVYNEVELRRTNDYVGAYNQKVVQEINGNLYTFCPNGIFATNLFSAKSIGEPVAEFFKNFTPIFNPGSKRTATNTHSWTFDNSYFLYINDITVPTATNDVVLEYDTLAKEWSVHDGGFTDFFHVNLHPAVAFGVSPIADFPTTVTNRPTLIGGDSSGKVWRLNENRFMNSSNTVVGSDILTDRRSNTGNPISAVIETPLYDLTHPELFKKFKNLRVLTESGQWNFEYRVENERGITAYRPLGSVSTTNQVLPFPGDAQGWRCGFRISSVSSNAQRIFNGFVFEETEVVKRP